jgi:hypothetical protein
MMRFDVLMRSPIQWLPIAWEHVNLPWRGERQYWASARETSDLWAILPSRHAEKYRKALIYSGTYDGRCCAGAARARRSSAAPTHIHIPPAGPVPTLACAARAAA